MKRALVAVLFGCMTLGLASLAFAGNNANAGIAIHVGPSVTKLPCDTLPSLTNATIVPEGNGLFEYNAYVLVCNGSDREGDDPANPGTGVAGMEFGLDYNGVPLAGVDIFQWTLCADLDFPSAGWPAAGSGTVITWAAGTNCQELNSEPFVPNTVIAIGGVLNVSVYGPDIIAVTPRPVTGVAAVADCNAALDVISGQVPSQLGVAAFELGPNSGYSPCGEPTPVENTTWGAIKKSY